MSNQNATESHAAYIDRLTRENASKAFEEFPKSLYHPDSRHQIVTGSQAQSALGGEWFEKPQEAIDERERRDKAAADKFTARVNAEAAEKAAAERGMTDKPNRTRAA